MIVRIFLLSAACLIFFYNGSLAEEAESKYLTADGKLIGLLSGKTLQGGFAGFTGREWVIDPDGEWMIGTVQGGRLTPQAQGKLSAEEIEAVAEILQRFDILGLPRQAGDFNGANPLTMELHFGEHISKLKLPPGDVPSPPDNGEPSVEQRIGGVMRAIEKLLDAKM